MRCRCDEHFADDTLRHTCDWTLMDRPVVIVGLPLGAGVRVAERLLAALEPEYKVVLVASEQRTLTVHIVRLPGEERGVTSYSGPHDTK